LHARELLERHRINQLPVVHDGRVVGIVTDRNLRDVFPSTLESARRKSRHHAVDPDRVRVGDVMSQPVYSLSADDSMREAAGLLRRLRIGAVPILDEKGRLYGILTRSDLLRALADNVDPHDL
jgi:CBS domain-containing protein